MNQQRRHVLRLSSTLGLALAAGLIRPERVWAAAQASDWNAKAFGETSVDGVFNALGGAQAMASDQITVIGPDIAENGAVVPVGASSKLPNTQRISLLVGKNPNPLAASFAIPAGTQSEVSTRVKMSASSDIYALVQADGKFYMAKKEIKVTLGGCGG